MERVRIMCWCSTCVSGLHLPAFAAAEGGLFADVGVEVEFVNCAPAPDLTLSGFTRRPRAVADGEADFALSSVAYLLAAQTETGASLPVRFAAVLHQRNPIAAIVRGDSDLHEPSDLPGVSTAVWNMPWFTREYAGALEHLGLGPPVLVDTYEARVALERGDVDVIPAWIDMAVELAERCDFPIRTIPLDIDVYATGLMAADRLPLELVARVRDAIAAGYELQRDRPTLGTEAFRRRFPATPEERIRSTWDVFEQYAFDHVPAGSMDADRWEATIDYTVATHGVSPLAGERLYRPELVAPAPELILA